MSFRNGIPPLAIDRLELDLVRGTAFRRQRAIGQIRRALGIPEHERGNPGVLRSLDEATLGNLRASPHVSAVILRLTTAYSEYLIHEMEQSPSPEWAARTLAGALPSVPKRFRSWICGCFIHGNLPIRSALQPLLCHLQDGAASLRRVAAKILENACIHPAPIGIDLNCLVRDPVREVRFLARHWMARTADAFLEQLAGHLKSGRGRDRRGILFSLRGMATRISDLIPALTAPRSDWTPLSADPASLLHRFRESSFAVVPALVRGVGARDARTSSRATQALIANWRGLSRHAARFDRYLRSRDDHVRANALRLLPLSGREEAAYLALLRCSLDDPKPAVALAAAETLIRRGALTTAGITKMQVRLGQWEPSIAVQAAHFLAPEGGDPGQLLPPLLRGVRHPDAEVRLLAVRTLGRLRPVPRRALTPLRHALADPDINVRNHALWALEPMSKAIRRDRRRIRHIILDQHSVPGGFSSAALRRKLRRWLPRT
jgi:hypothetical protein